MKPTLSFILIHQTVETDLPPGTVTLGFIREYLGLKGTKEGCGEGECGACTVLLGQTKDDTMTYRAVASCLLPIGELAGKHVITVEGLNNDTLNPIQHALVDEGAIQCGFCTPGFVLALTGFFLNSPNLEYQDAIDAMDGNICRCTGYVSIRKAAQNLCNTYSPKLDTTRSRLEQLVEWTVLPDYFSGVPERLQTLTQEKESPAKKGKGKKESFLVAGGTDLFVQIPKKLEDGNLRFMSNRADLQDISEDDGFVVIGAGVSSQQLRNSPILNRLLPGIKENFNLVSSTIMRNRATAAGNIVNASPIGDISIMLLALDATLCLAKKDKKRELPLKSFFKGYKQMDLKKDEIIEFIKVPVPSKNSRYHFEKVSQRKILDIASCNSAISLETEDNCISKIHLSAGGVSPIPLFLAKTCAFLTGKAPAPGTLKEALGIMDSEISPISDVRGSARYKKRLLRHLVTAHFITLFPEENFEEVLA